MMFGYARTSTIDQKAGLEAQVRDLKAAGCGHIETEEASAVGERPVFDLLLTLMDRGDVLVVTKLDRLARHTRHLGEIVDRLKTAGITLRILGLGLDTGTPTGMLMLNVLGAVAQFEREMMLERQREGIAKAKAEGVYKGTRSRYTDEEIAASWNRNLFERNIYQAMAGQLGCSRSQAIRLVSSVRAKGKVQLARRA